MLGISPNMEVNNKRCFTCSLEHTHTQATKQIMNQWLYCDPAHKSSSTRKQLIANLNWLQICSPRCLSLYVRGAICFYLVCVCVWMLKRNLFRFMCSVRFWFPLSNYYNRSVQCLPHYAFVNKVIMQHLFFFWCWLTWSQHFGETLENGKIKTYLKQFY